MALYSSTPVFFSYWRPQDWTQYSSSGLLSAEEEKYHTFDLQVVWCSPGEAVGLPCHKSRPDLESCMCLPQLSRAHHFSSSQEIMPCAIQMTAEQPGTLQGQFFEYTAYEAELRFFYTSENNVVKPVFLCLNKDCFQKSWRHEKLVWEE